MALEMNDLMMLRGMDKEGFSPYEQVKINHMQSKHPSGTAIGALAVGVGAAVLAVGAGAWAGSRAQNAKDVAIAKNDGLRDLVTSLATTVAAERNERINGDVTLNQTITDTVSGSQQGQLTAQQMSELSAINSATASVTTGLLTGQYSQNPIKVVRVSGQRECDCETCNGCR